MKLYEVPADGQLFTMAQILERFALVEHNGYSLMELQVAFSNFCYDDVIIRNYINSALVYYERVFKSLSTSTTAGHRSNDVDNFKKNYREIVEGVAKCEGIYGEYILSKKDIFEVPCIFVTVVVTISNDKALPVHVFAISARGGYIKDGDYYTAKMLKIYPEDNPKTTNLSIGPQLH